MSTTISGNTTVATLDRNLPMGMRELAGLPQLAALRRLVTRARQFRNQALVLCVEGVLAELAFTFSVLLLEDVYGPVWVARVLSHALPWVVSLRLLSFMLLGSYRFSLRVASIPEFISIGKAVSLSSLAFYAVTRLAHSDVRFPAALFILDWTLSMLLLSGLHFGIRLYGAQRAMGRRGGKRALIIGAGDAGTSVLKELVLDSASTVLLVGLIDDDPEKRGIRICGVPVLGNLRELPRLAREQRAEEILICVPSATRLEMRAILAQCRKCGIPIRTLPSIMELMDGRVGQRDFRRVQIEDILQREALTSDPAIVREVVGDRVVLVTGAGGSIGSELCRQIAAGHPRKLILLERSENSLFYINLQLQEGFPTVSVEPRLVDVTWRDQVREIFEQNRPEVVFHAAAHKHVHLLELHPQEAVRNNVLATRNVAMAALEFGTARFVNISTDKAVNPRNYMGLSKKVTEQLIRELAQSSQTRFMNVRFGNVAGSTGSVLRLFRDQIQNGGPIRISDPRATRYFMTIAEAVCLILHAAAQGRGGETFVFDMGEPVNIYEMARTFSLLSGLAPGKDLPFEFVGLKRGEKITEELWEPWEKPESTAHSRILALSGATRRPGQILPLIEELERLLARADDDGVLACLHRAFPKFAEQHEPYSLRTREKPAGDCFRQGGRPHERAAVLS